MITSITANTSSATVFVTITLFESGAVGASRIYDENVYAVLKEGEI